MLSATTAITPMRPVLTLWLVLRTLFLPFCKDDDTVEPKPPA